MFSENGAPEVFRVSDAKNIREQRDKWAAQIAELQVKVDEADRKLAAAELLFGRPFLPDSEVAAKADEGGAASESMAEVALRIVNDENRAMSNGEIRKELAKIDDFRERMEKNPNYYYTIMKRHVDRGRLRKRQDGKYEPM